MPSLLGLGLLIAVYPPSAFERSLIRLLASLPDWLDPLWEIVYDTLGLLALALAVLALAGRRPAVLAQAALSVALGVAITVVSSRLAVGRWPDPDDLARLRVDEATFPVLRVALAATVVLAVVPHLVRPIQRAGRWILLLGLLGGVLVEATAPSGTLAALLVALVAATGVRLAFGTSAGHPEARRRHSGAPRARHRGRAAPAGRPAARRRLRRARARDRRRAPAREGLRARRLRHAAAREGLAHGSGTRTTARA